MKENFKIGVALGSGAARGLAHIGVLEVLNEYNINIDLMSGSSIGALLGALYCMGMDFKYVKGILKALSPTDYLDVSVPSMGLVKGEKIMEILKLVTRSREFNDLKIPFYVTATDLKNKELKIINDGKVYEAIRASISIPGIFVPYVKDDAVLVDGGVLERVPVKILKENGADYVIGVDVGYNMNDYNCRNIFDILYASLDLIQREYFSLKKQDADLMINIDLNDADPFKFDQVDLCVEKGREAAKRNIEKIINDINSISEKVPG